MSTVIIPGKHGDIIQMLPALEKLSKKQCAPVTVAAVEPYLQTLEGASYVKPERLGGDWKKAAVEGRRIHPEAVIPQFWLDPMSDELMSHSFKNPVVASFRGKGLYIDGDKFPDYGTAMWVKMGYKKEDMLKGRPKFDQRDADRERALVDFFRLNGKPSIVMALESESSPFGWVPELVNALNQRFRDTVRFINIHRFRCVRIFDMLGLLDAADGLITADSALFHLAAASKKPWIGLRAPGWSGSIARNACMSLVYPEVPVHMEQILEMVTKMCSGELLKNAPTRVKGTP